MKLTDKKIAWIQVAFAALFLWGIANVGIGYSSKVLGVNVILFTCISFATCSLMLFYSTGFYIPKRITNHNKNHNVLWFFGIISFIIYIFLFLLFSKVSATEGSLLIMLGMNMSFVISWVYFKRKHSPLQLIGNIIVLIGIIMIGINLDIEIKPLAYLLTFVISVIVTIRVFVSEENSSSGKMLSHYNFKEKILVISYTMFLISLITLIFCFVLIYIKHLDVNNTINILKIFPNIQDFLNHKTIFAGIIYGAFLMGPLRYIEFSVASRIKAENYLAITALAPASTLFWEWSTSNFTGLDVKTISSIDIIALIIITVGAFIAAISQVNKKKTNSDILKEYLNYSPQELNLIQETRELIANALEHFHSDIKKTSNNLKIPKEVIKAILQDNEKVLSFNKQTLMQTASNYRKNIANADALTGLLNRIGFLTALKAASFESENLSLFYIDLNKFKPVNDTYGHEAGDFVLQKTGERLQNLFGEEALTTRLGGDEFCILLVGVNKNEAKHKIDTIANEIEKEISFNENKINISGSIGLASYPEDTANSQELLDLADQQMFTDKSER